jgi:hypothetical protein
MDCRTRTAWGIEKNPQSIKGRALPEWIAAGTDANFHIFGD